MIEDDDLSGAGDWTRPGVYRCAPDVYRIPLPLPMDGLRAVNVYAVRHGAEITVIDAGWSIPEARDAARRRARRARRRVPRRAALPRHAHPPRPLHAGRGPAPRVRDAGGARPRRAARPRHDQRPGPARGPDHGGPAAAGRRGGGAGEASGLRSPHLDMADWAAPDEWIDDGERLARRRPHARRRRDPRPHPRPPGLRRRGGRHHVLRRPRAAPDHAVDRAGAGSEGEPAGRLPRLARADPQAARRPDAGRARAGRDAGARAGRRADRPPRQTPRRHPRRARRGPQHRLRRGGRADLDPSRAHARPSSTRSTRCSRRWRRWRTSRCSSSAGCATRTEEDGVAHYTP